MFGRDMVSVTYLIHKNHLCKTGEIILQERLSFFKDKVQIFISKFILELRQKSRYDKAINQIKSLSVIIITL